MTASASYDAQDTCDPTAKPGAVGFKDFILKTYPSTGDYGITRACNSGGTSEHKEGRAWDWKVNYNITTQRDIADTVIGWLLDTDQHGNACANARRLGMMYFIWNNKITRGRTARPTPRAPARGGRRIPGRTRTPITCTSSWAWPGAKQTTWWTSALPPEPVNTKPKGYLDGASCERVWGWSQDTDAPTKSIAVHLYFGGPAGEAKAKGVPVDANLDRSDLCTPLGSCNHGFEVASPLGLHDGKPHAVHAYGIDTAGGANAELTQSTETLDCDAVIPAGSPLGEGHDQLRRLGLLRGLGRDAGRRRRSRRDPRRRRVARQPALGAVHRRKPRVWLIDGEFRRQVPNLAVLATWGFDSAAIVKWATKDLEKLQVGPEAAIARPVLVRGSGDKIYLMDGALPEAQSPAGTGGGGSGSGGASSGGSSSATGGKPGSSSGQQTKVLSDDEQGCACRATGNAPSSRLRQLSLLALGLIAARRRRARTA